MGQKIKFGLIVIILILIDIFSRFLYAQSWFSSSTFKKELDPFIIFSLIVTTLLTLWLGWYVSKKFTEQRYEKEFIITDLKQIEEEIKYLERNLLSSSLDIQNVLGMLIKLKIYIDRFSMTIEIFKISTLAEVKVLDDNYKKLYKKTTDIDGNILILDSHLRNEISQVCSKLIGGTRQMIFKINKN